MYLSWYSFSASPFFNWLGKVFEWSFRILQKLGVGPDAFYVTLIIVLLGYWLMRMRKYDAQAKDKGLID